MAAILFVGYYCPTGSSYETEIICPEAMYCGVGSPSPTKCPAGQFTDYEGATECDICPEGYYCIPDLIVAGESLPGGATVRSLRLNRMVWVT